MALCYTLLAENVASMKASFYLQIKIMAAIIRWLTFKGNNDTALTNTLIFREIEEFTDVWA